MWSPQRTVSRLARPWWRCPATTRISWQPTEENGGAYSHQVILSFLILFNAHFCSIGRYTVKAELGKQRSKEVFPLYLNNGLIKDQGELGGKKRCNGAQGWPEAGEKRHNFLINQQIEIADVKEPVKEEDIAEEGWYLCIFQKNRLYSRRGVISNLAPLSVKTVCPFLGKDIYPIMISSIVLKSVLWRGPETARAFCNFQKNVNSLHPNMQS